MSRTELYGVGDRVPSTSSCGDKTSVSNVSSFDILPDMNNDDKCVSDVVLEENPLGKSEGFTVQTKDIYTAYCQFCLSSGVVPHNKKDVYSAIEAQGFRRFKKNNTLFFMGLRLQSTVETLF